MSVIALIRPPLAYSKGAFSKPAVPPLGVAYLAASLRAHNHDVHVIDAVAEDIDRIEPSVHPQLVYRGISADDIIRMIPQNSEAIAISAMFSADWPHTESVIAHIHKAFPFVPIIIGGEHATATYDYILERCFPVSVVALGEGEETICEFADYVERKRELQSIHGIAYRQGGRIFKTQNRPRLKNIDEFPLPAWDLIPLHIYHQTGYAYGVNLGKSMPILATRGCPYQCTFCSSPLMWTTRYYMKTPSKVVDEIELYMKTYGAENFDFYDLTAILKRDWILTFCDEILKRNLKLTFQLPVGTRSEALDTQVLHALYDAGCHNLCYAPESGSNRILTDIKKHVNLKKLNRSLKEAASIGLTVKVSLIIGFPKESRIEMYQTIWLMLKYALYGIDDAGLYAFSPYPGTELFNNLRDKKIISELDNDYFASLSYLDFTKLTSYCEKVGPIELSLYRVLGMSLFYFLTYIRKPVRVFITLRNILKDRSETVFEQKVIEWLKRRQGYLKSVFEKFSLPNPRNKALDSSLKHKQMQELDSKFKV